MSVNVQYVGFESQARVRKYSFLVREAENETREFTLAIVNEAFSSRRVRFQDAPAICSARLHRELATFSNHPPQTHYQISDGELNEYSDAHAPRAAHGFYPRKVAK